MGAPRTPEQERIVQLYEAGESLRAIGDFVGKSHEWVRIELMRMGAFVRNPGAPVKETQVTCAYCGKVCMKKQSTARFCTRRCYHLQRISEGEHRMREAVRLSQTGLSLKEVAERLGMKLPKLRVRLCEYGMTPFLHKRGVGIERQVTAAYEEPFGLSKPNLIGRVSED